MNIKKPIITLSAVLALVVASFSITGCSKSEQTETVQPVSSSEETASANADAKPYPLDKCIVTDEDFHGDPYVFVHNGQEVKLCCKECLPDFKKEPAKYMAKLEAKK